MRIVVPSCWRYRDTWAPFAKLLETYWPNHPYALLLTDHYEKWDFLPRLDVLKLNRSTTDGICDESWCSMLAYFAKSKDGATGSSDEPILLLQDDFFLNAPVNELLIKKGLEQLQERNAAMVRLYPCPGGDIPYGDKWYAEIPKGAAYRVSCQATIWRPDVLQKIAYTCDTPADFEITGSKVSNEFDEPFLAFKREAQPWPLSYICSAISRSKWNPQALEFCKQQGIDVDLSMREVA